MWCRAGVDRVYILNMDKLKAGDIILTAQVGVVSKAVRLATGSNFSHAILYLGDGSFIHSDRQGVHSNNIQRILFEKEEHVEVYRLLDDSYVAKACMFARSKIGTSYSVKEAVRTKSPLSKRQKSSKQFCSRLVAQSYEFSGIMLVSNIDYCTPKDLQGSQFTKVVLGCLTEADDNDILFAKSSNPLQIQAEITNGILADVRKLTNKDVQNFEDLDQFVIDNPSYDNAITNIVKRSGYLNMFDYEMTKNPWRYNGEIFLALNVEPSFKRERAEFELQSAMSQVKLYSHNYQMCQHILARWRLKYFEMKMGLYKELINRMNKRIEAARYVIEHT